MPRGSAQRGSGSRARRARRGSRKLGCLRDGVQSEEGEKPRSLLLRQVRDLPSRRRAPALRVQLHGLTPGSAHLACASVRDAAAALRRPEATHPPLPKRLRREPCPATERAVERAGLAEAEEERDLAYRERVVFEVRP